MTIDYNVIITWIFIENLENFLNVINESDEKCFLLGIDVVITFLVSDIF